MSRPTDHAVRLTRDIRQRDVGPRKPGEVDPSRRRVRARLGRIGLGIDFCWSRGVRVSRVYGGAQILGEAPTYWEDMVESGLGLSCRGRGGVDAVGDSSLTGVYVRGSFVAAENWSADDCRVGRGGSTRGWGFSGGFVAEGMLPRDDLYAWRFSGGDCSSDEARDRLLKVEREGSVLTLRGSLKVEDRFNWGDGMSAGGDSTVSVRKLPEEDAVEKRREDVLKGTGRRPCGRPWTSCGEG